MTAPEAKARTKIDELLEAAGWSVQDAKAANIHAARGVAIREFPLTGGHGFADYLLYVDGRAAGVIEAKKSGVTLTGVEVQSAEYTTGLPEGLPAWHNPLPFCYESTGLETRFTNGLDPAPSPYTGNLFYHSTAAIKTLEMVSSKQVKFVENENFLFLLGLIKIGSIVSKRGVEKLNFFIFIRIYVCNIF